jgi:hypothetical protein
MWKCGRRFAQRNLAKLREGKGEELRHKRIVSYFLIKETGWASKSDEGLVVNN